MTQGVTIWLSRHDGVPGKLIKVAKMRGWSLVEVMIAVAVIVIAFIPVVNLVSSNAVSTVKVGNYAKAAGLLSKFMEEVKHVPIKKYQEEKGVGFVQGYALTETGRLTSLDLEDSISKAGSVGKEVFHINLRIVDDQGNDLPPLMPGEILVKGPNVFAGYWGKDAATGAAIGGPSSFRVELDKSK